MNGNDLWNFNGLNSTGGKTPRIINPLWPFDQVSALPANQIARVAVRWTNSVPAWAKRLANHNVPSQTPCNTWTQNLTDLNAFGSQNFPVFIVFITLTPGQELFSPISKTNTSLCSSPSIHSQSINDSSRKQKVCANRRKNTSTSKL